MKMKYRIVEKHSICGKYLVQKQVGGIFGTLHWVDICHVESIDKGKEVIKLDKEDYIVYEEDTSEYSPQEQF